MPALTHEVIKRDMTIEEALRLDEAEGQYIQERQVMLWFWVFLGWMGAHCLVTQRWVPAILHAAIWVPSLFNPDLVLLSAAGGVLGSVLTFGYCWLHLREQANGRKAVIMAEIAEDHAARDKASQPPAPMPGNGVFSDNDDFPSDWSYDDYATGENHRTDN